METTSIRIAADKLCDYIQSERLQGYDPYDGLNASFWKLPLLRNATYFQFLFQQFIKRFPYNLRPYLGIHKSLNPVSAGLMLQGYAVQQVKRRNYALDARCTRLIGKLEKLRSENYSGYCWGYNFTWSSRYVLIPAYQPTIVATGIIINALYEYWKVSGDKTVASMVASSAEFILKDLHKTIDADGTFCFSYSPFDKEQVYNASMKGVRILSQAYSITGNEEFKKNALLAATWVVKRQREDGAWKYSESAAGGKSDNYHTGYVLDCLADCINYCNAGQFNGALLKGRAYYLNHFFNQEGQPSFYDDSQWPADCTAGGQAILSLTKMGELKLAERTAMWMINEMQDPSGYFYFRKYPAKTIKTSFMRWSNAWMFAALNTLLAAKENGGTNA